MCAQQRLRSAWASAKSDPSLNCSHPVHMKKAWVLSYPCSAQQRLFTGCTVILLVLSWGGSYYRSLCDVIIFKFDNSAPCHFLSFLLFLLVKKVAIVHHCFYTLIMNKIRAAESYPQFGGCCVPGLAPYANALYARHNVCTLIDVCFMSYFCLFIVCFSFQFCFISSVHVLFQTFCSCMFYYFFVLLWHILNRKN